MLCPVADGYALDPANLGGLPGQANEMFADDADADGQAGIHRERRPICSAVNHLGGKEREAVGLGVVMQGLLRCGRIAGPALPDL